MSETLKVEKRDATGTSATKRLRRDGFVPGNLYGHGQDNVNLAIVAEDWEAIVRQGARVVRLEGAATDTALVTEVQWDTYGSYALHVDLLRVSEDERIETAVKVELRGEAEGSKQGGIIKHMLHEVTISCLAVAIPESISVSIKALKLGDTLTAGDLSIPDNTSLVTAADETVVTCVDASGDDEETPAVAVAGEPEVIGARSDEDEDES